MVIVIVIVMVIMIVIVVVLVMMSINHNRTPAKITTTKLVLHDHAALCRQHMQQLLAAHGTVAALKAEIFYLRRALETLKAIHYSH